MPLCILLWAASNGGCCLGIAHALHQKLVYDPHYGLSLASRQDRSLALLSFAERQRTRFALSLRAAGLDPHAVLEQLVRLDPDVVVPEGLDMVPCDRAAVLLAASQPEAVL